MKSKFKLDNIIYILSIVFISYVFIAKKFQNDVFFDIKTGESILKYGIDHLDHFSFIPNLIYLYHHWLYDVILYYMFSKVSFVGTFFFFVGVFSIFSIIYYKICNKITNSKLLSFIITAIVTISVSCFMQTRVQTITYVLFLLEILSLEKIYNGNKKWCILLIISSILIVNLHMPLWILTIILSLPFLVEGLISYICDNDKKIKSIVSKYITVERPHSYKLLFISIGILLFTGFISPHGINPYIFFIKVLFSKGFKIITISELKKTRLIEWGFGLVLIIVMIIGLYLKKFKVKLRDLFMFLGLFVFMLIAIRNVVYFTYIVPLVLIRSYYDNHKNKEIKLIDKYKSRINTKVVGYTILVCVTVMMVMGIKTMDYKNYDFNINKDYPVEAVKYIKKNLDYKNIRIYNDFNNGSYLEYNDIPVFVDSRAEVYVKEFNGGTDVMSDYVNIDKLDKYKKIFKKYDFDYALVEKDDKLNYILSGDDNYKRVYSDKKYVIYEVKK